MLTAIDHLVIVVSDLEAAVERYGLRGFAVAPGGRHTTTGTHNALIALADGSYLELLAFYEPDTQSPWWRALDHGGGLFDFCVQTDDLRADVARLREAGIAMSDPTPMGRVRPDGYRLEWVLSTPNADLRGIVPFLIEDLTPRSERVPGNTVHPNEAIGLDTLTLAVEDLAAVCGRYRAILGREGSDVEAPDVGGAGQRFAIGPHHLDVLAPTTASGLLAGWLERSGASLFGATLATKSPRRVRLDRQT